MIALEPPKDGRWWRVPDLDLEILCDHPRDYVARQAKRELAERRRRVGIMRTLIYVGVEVPSQPPRESWWRKLWERLFRSAFRLPTSEIQ
jgi:hypothetical protein